MNKTKTNYLG